MSIDKISVISIHSPAITVLSLGEGLQGPTGVQGPVGAQGPAGVQGPPGSADYMDLVNVPLSFTPSVHNHPATVVTFAPSNDMSSINVQDAIIELAQGKATEFHVHTATDITMTPSGSILSENVQAALQELDSEKQAALVSGTNIKTLNGSSLLGSGDVVIVGGVTVSDTAPSNPSSGQGWFDLNTGLGFIWVDDGTSSAWVESGSVGTATIASIIGLQTILDGKAAYATTNTWTVGQIGAYATLTSSAASIAVNLASSPKFTHTLTENTTLAAPTSPIAGQGIDIEFIQNSGTARTLAYNAFYHFVGSVPVISTTLNSRSRLVGTVRSTANGADVSLQGPFV